MKKHIPEKILLIKLFPAEILYFRQTKFHENIKICNLYIKILEW